MLLTTLDLPQFFGISHKPERANLCGRRSLVCLVLVSVSKGNACVFDLFLVLRENIIVAGVGILEKARSCFDPCSVPLNKRKSIYLQKQHQISLLRWSSID